MKIKRMGKCASCSVATTEVRTFASNVDIFNPTAEIKLEGDLLNEIRAWRKTKLYCRRHRKDERHT